MCTTQDRLRRSLNSNLCLIKIHTTLGHWQPIEHRLNYALYEV